MSSQYLKRLQRKPGKLFFTKRNNSCKRRSSVTKLKLDLYYVNTYSYPVFTVNISKDCKEKSGKLNFYKGQ